MKSSSSSSSDDILIEEIQIVNTNIMLQQPKYTGAIPKNSSSALLAKPKVEHLPSNFQSVVSKINQGFRICVILRGLPGSGKSFLSHQIVEQSVKTQPDDHIVSADKFFINRNGVYNFDPSKLTDAHNWAQRTFLQKASQGLSPLIVDNTNVQTWEMFPYLQGASQYGYCVEVMEPATPWKSTASMLAKKTQHSVPEDKIKRMKENFEQGDLELLMKSLNLTIVREPSMRKLPPLEAAEAPKIPSNLPQNSFQVSPVQKEDSTDSPLPHSSSSATPQEVTSFDTVFEQIFDKKWDEPEVKPEPKVPVKVQDDPQPQRKQKKGKSSQKLTPHRKDCPNENETFAIVRNMYSSCKDSYLWDLFVRCEGDADWCVNLLCDENLADQMDSGSDLTCPCFGNDVTKTVTEKVKKTPQPQSSPTGKSKKTKTEAFKQINMDEWRLETKEMIEKSITIGQEHYPEHVNRVKEWKNPQSQPLAPPEDQCDLFDVPTSSEPETVEERQQLTIDRNLILELDDEFGGGMLRSRFGEDVTFPPKILIRKSTAYQLFIDIMEAYYAQEEEKRLKRMKDDEEFAKMLNEEENNRNGPQPQPAPILNGNNVWVNDDDSNDDIAKKISKEKLIQLFPGIDKNSLMEIYEGSGYNFNETVALIEDSLLCTPEERKQIAASKKKVFNTPWNGATSKKKPEAVDEVTSSSDGYTEDHLKRVENLRQEISDHEEEQKACYMKAREAIQKKQFEVATHFSNIAALHKTKESEKKHEVANLMAGIHEKTHGSNGTTLDLHYHNLIEASYVFDQFMDKHIERLRQIGKPFVELSIITGKGAHSINGVANIKIQTRNRIKDRKLNPIDVPENPGILKVKVYPNSHLTNEIDQLRNF